MMDQVDRLWGVPQRADVHPEVDTGVHLMLVLDMAARLAAPPPLIRPCAQASPASAGLFLCAMRDARIDRDQVEAPPRWAAMGGASNLCCTGDSSNALVALRLAISSGRSA